MRYLRFFFFVIPIGLIGFLVLDVGLRSVLVDEMTAEGAPFPMEHAALFYPDAYGMVRPHLHVEISTPPFTIDTNAFGMRMGEIQTAKNPGVVRIAVLGDSLAFGWGLPVEEAFPSKLQASLNAAGNTKYEVLNFAAPGFTSLHAIKQYERIVHNFQPDILILALGLFDSYECRFSEPEIFSILERYGMVSGTQGLLGFLNAYSTVGHWLVKQKQQQINAEIQRQIAERSRENTWKPKVPPDSQKNYLKAIIDHHQLRGGKTILVNGNLFNFDTHPALQELSESLHLPLLDIRSVFEGVGGYEERKKHFSMNLQVCGIDYFDSGSETRYLYRVHCGDTLSITKGVYITGNLPELGNGIPNSIRMYDDGTHGDERAGDRVWSLQILLPHPQPVHFTFTSGGVQGQWSEKETGLEHTAKNQRFEFEFTPPASEPVILWRSPIFEINQAPFGHLLQSPTSPLPNANGHTAIARRLEILVRGLMDEKP